MGATCEVQSALDLKGAAGSQDDCGSDPRLDQSLNERWKLPGQLEWKANVEAF